MTTMHAEQVEEATGPKWGLFKALSQNKTIYMKQIGAKKRYLGAAYNHWAGRLSRRNSVREIQWLTVLNDHEPVTLRVLFVLVLP